MPFAWRRWPITLRYHTARSEAPILGLAAVTGLPSDGASASIGNVVALLALLPPWVLIYLVSGWEGVGEAWPLAIVGSRNCICAGQWPAPITSAPICRI